MQQRRFKIKQLLLALFCILTITNIAIYFFRDRFAYFPYTSYSSLYGTCNKPCRDNWKQFIDDYPTNDLPEAKKVTDSILQPAPNQTIEKVLKLAGFLQEKFKSRIGKPTDSLNIASPLDQYKMLCENESAELWCGNFANMFAFFCWAEGIPCRIIEIMNSGDHHVVNECYIPEINKWVMVDITSNQLLTQTIDNRLMNVLDFKTSLSDSTPLVMVRAKGKTVWTDTNISKPTYLNKYYKKDNPLYYYHRINNAEVYKPMLKLYRYIFPVSWFKIIAEKKHSNFPFYLKQFAILLWTIAGLLLIIVKLKGKIKKRPSAI